MSPIPLQLIGHFDLRRRFSNGSSFAGVANISQDQVSDRYLYCETGALSLPVSAGQTSHADPQSFTATQTYFLTADKDGLHIFFKDERPFQRIALRPTRVGLTGRADHLCAADFYQSRYVLSDHWVLVMHRVTGPRKNYLSWTQMRRKR